MWWPVRRVAVLGMRLVYTLAMCAALGPIPVVAEPRWIKAKFGPFEAISDEGRRPAVEALNQFVQFSFALGSALGQPDLRLDPSLFIIVFKDQKELAAECPEPVLREGRERLMVCATPEGRLSPDVLRGLTRQLLTGNFSRMPAPVEQAVETFFSTIQVSNIHVTWGTPPPAAERTREWALLHRILTQPELSARAKIYLHNLAAGMESKAAARNAFGEDAAQFEADTDRYFAAGVFQPSPAPNRALNPDRDIYSTAMTSDEGALARADLLTPASAGIYQELLKNGKQIAASNEGLAMLSLRAGNLRKAGLYVDAARGAGTQNFVLLTAYAEREPDTDKAIEIVREALTVNPKYAPGHWVFGEKLTDPARRAAEWKQATELAPRRHDWLARYAALCLDRQQFAEAGRAWSAAALAAPTEALRDEYLAQRGRIETERLEAEDVERRRIAEEKAAETARLKDEARSKVARLEARVNTNPLSKEEAANVVDYEETDAALAERSPVIEGALLRVECSGNRLSLTIKDARGRLVTLLVPDAHRFEVRPETELACGVQAKQMRVKVSYLATKDQATKDQAMKAAPQKASPPKEAALGQALAMELIQ